MIGLSTKKNRSRILLTWVLSKKLKNIKMTSSQMKISVLKIKNHSLGVVSKVLRVEKMMFLVIKDPPG